MPDQKISQNSVADQVQPPPKPDQLENQTPPVATLAPDENFLGQSQSVFVQDPIQNLNQGNPPPVQKPFQPYPPKPSDQDIEAGEELPPPPPSLPTEEPELPPQPQPKLPPTSQPPEQPAPPPNFEPPAPPATQSQPEPSLQPELTGEETIQPPQFPQSEIVEPFSAPVFPPTPQPAQPEPEPEKPTLPAKSENFSENQTFKFASLGQRIFALILDVLIIGSISAALYFGLTFVNLTSLGQTKLAAFGLKETTVFAIAFLALYCAILIYPLTFTGIFGGTIGKLILGLQIVNRQGQHLTIAKAIVRTLLGYTLEALTLFFGFFWLTFDQKNQTLADKITNSLVIQNQPAKKILIALVLTLGLIIGTGFWYFTIVHPIKTNQPTQNITEQKVTPVRQESGFVLGENITFKVFTIQDPKLSIDYPAGWLVFEKPQAEILAEFASLDGVYRLTIQNPQAVSEDQSIDTLAKSLKEKIKTDSPLAQIGETENILVNSFAANRFESIEEIPKGTFRVSYLLLLKDDKIFILEASAPANLFHLKNLEFERMLESVK